MKKVININFQGRVIPIEDSAYDLLQQYIASLRIYFAKEEGCDEIINDIESRIGELFAEQLKKGASCITDVDVEAVMNNMGRPSDFEKADEEEVTATSFAAAGERPRNEPPYTNTGTGYNTQNRRLYRDEQDKILGGVASGLANYFNIDPAIVRLLFIVTTIFVGTGLLLYVILWIALPSKSLVNNIRKRLYRDTEDRIFKGVCGGLGKYFDINPLIPRIIFAAPFLLGTITTIGRRFFFDSSVFIGGFGGGSFFIAYLILWAVLPEAVTASEKLEMRGEKVDLNSIRNTIMDDMQGFRGRAERIKTEVQESASRIASNTRYAWQNQGQPFIKEATGAVRRNSGGIGHAIGVLIKAVIMIIGGLIAFSLLAALLFMLSTGVGRLELTDFILNGPWQKLAGLGVLVLFIGVPLLAIAISIIRRMMGAKTRNRYLSYIFSLLWTLGLICLILLVAFISRDFRYEQKTIEEASLVQPATNRLAIRLANDSYSMVSDDWFNWNGAMFIDNDSLYLNTIKVHVIRSFDTQYHIHVVKFSNGGNRNIALQRSQNLSFPIVQNGETILLPGSFTIGVKDKWRNQRVLVVVEVPVGKIINVGRDLNDYDWFDINNNRRTRTLDRHWYDDQDWNSDEDMIQTEKNLLRASSYHQDEEEQNDGNNNSQNKYRYPAPLPDSTRRTDTTYHYPARITQNTPQQPAANNPAAVSYSPLATFLW